MKKTLLTLALFLGIVGIANAMKIDTPMVLNRLDVVGNGVFGTTASTTIKGDTGTSTFSGGVEGWTKIMSPYFVGTSTSVASFFTYASTTAVSGTNVCIGTDCRTVWPASGSAYPFTTNTNYGVTVSATTTPLWLQAGFMASTTSYLANATTTLFTNTGSTWLKALSAGGLGIDSTGLVYSGATTTFSSPLVYTNGAVSLSTVPIASGGTNATSFGTSNGIVAYDGSKLTNYTGYTLTSSLLTAPNASTTNLTVGTFFTPPNQSTSPANTVAGTVVVNTNGTASSSIALGDGSLTHDLFAVHSMGIVVASSTLAYSGAYGTTGTTTLIIANPLHGSKMLSYFCKVDVGTVYVGFGTGSATTTETQCTTSGVQVTTSSNNTWVGRANVYLEVGHEATNPNNITITADVEDTN